MPPSVNKAYIQVGIRRVKSPCLVAFNLQMDAWAINSHRIINIATSKLRGCNLDLKLIFYFPTEKLFTKAGKPRKLDVSNRIKAIEDAFCRHLDIDDSYIFNIEASKRVGTHENVYLEITEYNNKSCSTKTQ